MNLKSMGILGSIFAMALSVRSSGSKRDTHASRIRRAPDNQCNPSATSFGNKLARKALKGTIGTRHGTGLIAKAYLSKAEKKRRNAA